jgi:Leucine-rich repeat (LRR) protein
MEVATSLGAAVAKFLFKRYLGEAGEVGGEALADVGKDKIKDALERRAAARKFEGVADRIVAKIGSSLEREGRLDGGVNLKAVAIELAATLEGRVSADEFLAADLDAASLTVEFRKVWWHRPVVLNPAEIKVFDRTLDEAVRYMVETAAALPHFEQAFAAQSLQRLRRLEDDIEEVLTAVHTIEKAVMDGDGDSRGKRFEADYRQAVIRNLDKVELFGADIPADSQRNLLTEAFVSLNVSPAPLADGNSELLPFESVMNLLSPKSGRLLIRGSAGSGKTTLMRWAAILAAKYGPFLCSIERTLEENRLNLNTMLSRISASGIEFQTDNYDADRRFSSDKTNWVFRLPFLILLRNCQDGQLPSPEEFPSAVGREIGRPPTDWVASVLAEGRSLVLIDGVDEVPKAKHSAIFDGIQAILTKYPNNYFVLTSRPEALAPGWLDGLGFREANVNPMSITDVTRFVHRWHHAVGKELARRGKPTAELESLADDLIAKLQDNPAISLLATNPLLCAMICALHRDRYRKLPETQRELCESLCHMLLHRRERESGLDWSMFPDSYRELRYEQKRGIVQELAQYMVLNELSAVGMPLARQKVADVLTRFPGQAVEDAKIVLDTLIVRSGMLREATSDTVDFLHNTFKEFLAGERFADEAHAGLLIKNALVDTSWRRVALFAVATPNRSEFASHFLRAILDLPVPESKKRPSRKALESESLRARHLFALQCRAVALYLDRDLSERLDGLIAKLFPPRALTDAEPLATLGDVAVPFLKKRSRMGEARTVASVRTLRLINTGAAKDVLQEYFGDQRMSVLVELAQAVNPLTIPKVLEMVQERKTLPPGIREQVTDLAPLAGLTDVRALNLEGTRTSNLAPLARLTKLQVLDLNRTSVIDLAPLAGLAELQMLNLARTAVIDLTPLARLIGLQDLNLADTRISDLTPLAGLTALQRLSLASTSVEDMRPVAGFTSLQWLHLASTRVTNLTPLSGLITLQTLHLSATPVSDLTPLTGLRNLQTLTLNITSVTDLGPLVGLTSLRILTVNATPVADLRPLAGLKALKRLSLVNTLVTDLAPLAGLTALKFLELDPESVIDLRPLGQLTGLEIKGGRG